MERFNFNLQAVLDLTIDTKNIKLSEIINVQKLLNSQLSIIDEIKNNTCKYQNTKSNDSTNFRIVSIYIELLNLKLHDEEKNFYYIKKLYKIKKLSY